MTTTTTPKSGPRPWRRPLKVAAWVLGSLLVLVFLVVGSLRIAASAGWDLLPLLPLTLATFHFAYGLGFFVSLLASPFKRA